MMMTNSIDKLRTRKGIGLLELMLALAIIAVLIIMATRYYQTTSRSQKIAEAVTTVNAIVSAASNWRIGRVGFNGTPKLDWKNLYDQGLLPKEMEDPKTASPWGAEITLVPVDNSTYEIGFPGLSTQECTALVGRFSASANIKAECSGGKDVKLTYYEKGTP